MQTVDLNSDMGEGFGPWLIGDGVDHELMAFISSANVATGFHAGDPSTMRSTIERAKALGVGVGAHPGFRDLVGFGRRHINASAQEIADDILYQLGALRELARAQGIELSHVKPHGALYMHLARDEVAARAVVEHLQRVDPALPLFCMPGSVIWRVATELGQPTVREFYADRDYDNTGSIVFTRKTRPLDPDEVAAKVVRACLEGVVRTVEGQDVAIDFDSICLHSDTPGALPIMQKTHEALLKAGVSICRHWATPPKPSAR
ncbi:5-oxoprolinase subunit PxpA [Pseudomonas putida]|uniref:5-oxoprolinase subunit PxpA n=1 Tax=Pseudomonas putida TaxID=303 RepID=UPI0023640C0A|nr:5-oxoprolinase subunit PxpA [Pseudomonas putida]MDD2004113.1 5-oxoprolinase subunit PxpA [Pseudomonas putida]